EQGGRQRAAGEVIGRRRRDRALRGSAGAAQGIGPHVVPERELVRVNQRQRGEAVAVVGGAGNRRLQNLADFPVFLQGDALPVTEGAQHGLVRGVFAGASASQRFAHAVNQRAVLIRDRRNNLRHQIVLQLEHGLRAETALVVLSPQMSSGLRINQLY